VFPFDGLRPAEICDYYGDMLTADRTHWSRNAAAIFEWRIGYLFDCGDTGGCLAALISLNQVFTDRYLEFRVLRQRHSDRIADAVFEKCPDADGRFDASVFAVAGFRNAQVKRIAYAELFI